MTEYYKVLDPEWSCLVAFFSYFVATQMEIQDTPGSSVCESP